MPLALFDIDGTLTASNAIDSICFEDAFRDVFGIKIDTDWNAYEHDRSRHRLGGIAACRPLL